MNGVLTKCFTKMRDRYRYAFFSKFQLQKVNRNQAGIKSMDARKKISFK